MKQSVFLLGALLAGFVGGALSSRVMGTGQQPHPERVIRARSFELVDEAGQTISYWGIDKGENAVLAFGSRSRTTNTSDAAHPAGAPFSLEDPRSQLTAIGLLADDNPFLKMSGADRKTRVRLYLSIHGKPFLLMEDETGPRISLGVEQSDTPGPQDNDWILDFGPDSRARIGMYTEKKGSQTYVRGIFSVKREKMKYP